jgi:glycosyltransferase involved in cell wall biosynthesis
MIDEITNHFKVPLDKLVNIPNAINMSKYNQRFERNNIRKQYGVSPDEKLILFVGRLVPQKGVEHLINAFPIIQRKHYSAKLLISGEGWSKSQLENIASSIDSYNRIQFLGFIPDLERVKLMMSSDILVIPSVYEPFGIVALEGMAAGIPVIVSKIGGLSEIVQHDISGVHVYPRDRNSIAWGIDKVLSNNEYRLLLIKNAKKRVRDIYSWKAISKRTIDLYKSILLGE